MCSLASRLPSIGMHHADVRTESAVILEAETKFLGGAVEVAHIMFTSFAIEAGVCFDFLDLHPGDGGGGASRGIGGKGSTVDVDTKSIGVHVDDRADLAVDFGHTDNRIEGDAITQSEGVGGGRDLCAVGLSNGGDGFGSRGAGTDEELASLGGNCAAGHRNSF